MRLLKITSLSAGLGLPLFDRVEAPEGCGFQDFDARVPFARVGPAGEIGPDLAAILGRAALRCRANRSPDRVETFDVGSTPEKTLRDAALHTGLDVENIRRAIQTLAEANALETVVRVEGPRGAVSLRLR